MPNLEDEIVKLEREHKREAKKAAKPVKAAQRVAEGRRRTVEQEELGAPDLGGSSVRRSVGRSEGRGEVRQGRSRLRVEGRNGEVLSRSHITVSDQFEIPVDLIPDGWSYQWVPVSITGNHEIVADMNHQMHQQGWRAVPAERYAGSLLPKNAKGPFVRGGQILMERPAVLTEEARAEDIYNARKLISDRNESLMLQGVKNQMPSGFEMGGKYRGTGGQIKMSIDQALDAPMPKHTLADE